MKYSNTVVSKNQQLKYKNHFQTIILKLSPYSSYLNKNEPLCNVCVGK